jgi:hypothetical protein
MGGEVQPAKARVLKTARVLIWSWINDASDVFMVWVGSGLKSGTNYTVLIPVVTRVSSAAGGRVIRQNLVRTERK